MQFYKKILSIFSSPELLIIIVLIFGFLTVRLVDYKSRFVFHFDNTALATRALESWEEKKFKLTGIEFSPLTPSGRRLQWSSLSIYMILGYLLLTNFDPFFSNLIFTISTAIAIPILFFGIKKLTGGNTKASIFGVTLFSFYPLFIDLSLQYWNLGLLMILWPFIILVYAYSRRASNSMWVFLLGVLIGIGCHLHLQMIPIVVLFLLLILLEKGQRLKNCLIYLLGFGLSMLPMIIFELRHEFYNAKTILELLQKPKVSQASTGFGVPEYYLMSFVIPLTTLLIVKLRRYIVPSILIVSYVVGMILSLQRIGDITHLPNSKPVNISYSDELKIFEIIKGNLKEYGESFNISHLPYDNLASVQKYLLKRENIRINWDDYYQNKYLYVTDIDGDFSEYTAYEIATFFPRKLLKQWKINDNYSLFLLERQSLVEN